MTKKKPKTGVVMQVSPRGAKTIKRLEGAPARRDDIDPPYDSREFLEDADKIIKQLLEPQSLKWRQRLGLDLSDKREAMGRLLAEVCEVYQSALDDWETRYINPEGIERKLEDNWGRDEIDSPYDYSEYDPGEEQPDWDEWYKEVYARGEGNDGRSSTGPVIVPVAPLRVIYPLVKRWWLEHVGAFRPRYPIEYQREPDDKTAPPRPFYMINPAGRLLLMVAWRLNKDYTAENCDGIRHTIKKQERKRRRSE